MVISSALSLEHLVQSPSHHHVQLHVLVLHGRRGCHRAGAAAGASPSAGPRCPRMRWGSPRSRSSHLAMMEPPMLRKERQMLVFELAELMIIIVIYIYIHTYIQTYSDKYVYMCVLCIHIFRNMFSNEEAMAGKRYTSYYSSLGRRTAW